MTDPVSARLAALEQQLRAEADHAKSRRQECLEARYAMGENMNLSTMLAYEDAARKVAALLPDVQRLEQELDDINQRALKKRDLAPLRLACERLISELRLAQREASQP